MDNVLSAVIYDGNGNRYDVDFTKPKRESVVYDYAFNFERDRFENSGIITVKTKLGNFSRNISLLFKNIPKNRDTISVGIIILPNRVEVDWHYCKIEATTEEPDVQENPDNIGVKRILADSNTNSIVKRLLRCRY